MERDLFTHILMLEPKNKYAHAGLGEIELGKGGNRKAIEHFANALLLDPKLIRPRIFLSRLLLKHFSQYELAAGHCFKAWDLMRNLKEFNQFTKFDLLTEIVKDPLSRYIPDKLSIDNTPKPFSHVISTVKKLIHAEEDLQSDEKYSFYEACMKNTSPFTAKGNKALEDPHILFFESMGDSTIVPSEPGVYIPLHNYFISALLLKSNLFGNVVKHNLVSRETSLENIQKLAKLMKQKKKMVFLLDMEFTALEGVSYPSMSPNEAWFDIAQAVENNNMPFHSHRPFFRSSKDISAFLKEYNCEIFNSGDLLSASFIPDAHVRWTAMVNDSSCTQCKETRLGMERAKFIHDIHEAGQASRFVKHVNCGRCGSSTPVAPENTIRSGHYVELPLLLKIAKAISSADVCVVFPTSQSASLHPWSALIELATKSCENVFNVANLQIPDTTPIHEGDVHAVMDQLYYEVKFSE